MIRASVIAALLVIIGGAAHADTLYAFAACKDGGYCRILSTPASPGAWGSSPQAYCERNLLKGVRNEPDIGLTFRCLRKEIPSWH